MSLSAGILATIIIQVGTGIWNYHSNKKHTEEIKRLQRERKKKNQEEEIKRSEARFELSCELQYQMEQEAHIERLNDINQGFFTSFEKYAHDQALSSYPLSFSLQFNINSIILLSSSTMPKVPIGLS